MSDKAPPSSEQKSDKKPDPAAETAAAAEKRNVARLVYGVLDLVLAAFYLYVFLALVPSRDPVFTALAVVFSAIMAAGGVGMLFMKRKGRLVATVSAGLMLGVCALLIAGLLSSMAYLHGIYGGVGQAGVALGGVAVALTFQFVGLVPALQLAFLWRTRPGAAAPGAKGGEGA
jgi:FtsH-binding integral membrane protein